MWILDSGGRVVLSVAQRGFLRIFEQKSMKNGEKASKIPPLSKIVLNSHW